MHLQQAFFRKRNDLKYQAYTYAKTLKLKIQIFAPHASGAIPRHASTYVEMHGISKSKHVLLLFNADSVHATYGSSQLRSVSPHKKMTCNLQRAERRQTEAVKKNGKLFLDGALRWAYVGGRTGKNGVEVLQSMNSPNSNALTGRKDRVHCSGGEACNREEKTTRRHPQGSHFDCRKALPCLATGMSRESKTMTTRHERYSNAMQLRIRQHFSAFHILF